MAAMLILGIIAIIAGILILIWPKILNLVIAIWLLVWGIAEILAYYGVFPLSVTV
ncbi:Uncharacterised protein [uncultured archaeon]|nr:Uncharacterised protein [uncultured archaeon]